MCYAGRNFKRLRLLGAAQQNGELVSADTGADISKPDRATKSICHYSQRIVARQMAQVIIDSLEVVQIDEQQREPIGRRPVTGGPKLIDKSLSVEQSGQAVMAREILDLLPSDTSFGNVRSDAAEATKGPGLIVNRMAGEA